MNYRAVVVSWWSLVICLTVTFGPAAPGWAGSIELEPIVIVDHQERGWGEDDFSVNRRIIDQTEITQSGARDLGELLNLIAGSSLMSESVFGGRTVGQGRVKLRGNNPLIMVDGRPVTMELFNCVINNQLSLSGVERIEVTRGAEAVLSGADALGGVVNIVTERPADYRSRVSKKAGSNSSFAGAVESSGGGAVGYYSLGYQYKTTDGHLENSELRSGDYFLKLGYFLSDAVELELTTQYYDGEYEDPLNRGAEQRWEKQRAGFDLKVDGVWENHRVVLQGYYNSGEHQRYLIDTGTLDFHTRDEMTGVRARQSSDFGRLKLIYGFDYREYGGRRLDPADGSRLFKRLENERAIYGMVNRELGQNTEVVVGGRYNDNSVYGERFFSKLGIKRKLGEQLSGRISYNRGFRNPSIMQLNNNPDLQPEIADNYELGIEYNRGGKWQAGLALFRVEGEDRIAGFPPENQEEYRHYGVEFEVTGNLSNNLRGGLTYSWIDPEDDTVFQFENRVTGQLSYRRKNWLVYLAGEYVNRLYAEAESQNRLPDYLKLDLRTSYQPPGGISYIVEVDNLLDVDYATQTYDDGTRMYNSGLTVFGGIEVEF